MHGKSSQFAKGRRESAMKRILAAGLFGLAAVIPFAPEVLFISWG
jgi:hypothetical protein